MLADVPKLHLSVNPGNYFFEVFLQLPCVAAPTQDFAPEETPPLPLHWLRRIDRIPTETFSGTKEERKYRSFINYRVR